MILLGLLTVTTIVLGRFAVQKLNQSQDIIPTVVTQEQCLWNPLMVGCEIYTIPEEDKHADSEHAAMITGIESYLFEMIPHHQEAVDSSQIFIKKTLFLWDELNPLQTIAQNIISGQVVEIEQLKWWITNNLSGSEYVSHYMPMMSSSDEDMTIPALEKMYAQDMIAHHQGAIDMSKKLLEVMKEEDKVIRVTEEGMKFRNDIKAFAQQVIDTQIQEIKSLQDELAVLSLSGTIL